MRDCQNMENSLFKTSVLQHSGMNPGSHNFHRHHDIKFSPSGRNQGRQIKDTVRTRISELDRKISQKSYKLVNPAEPLANSKNLMKQTFCKPSYQHKEFNQQSSDKVTVLNQQQGVKNSEDFLLQEHEQNAFICDENSRFIDAHHEGISYYENQVYRNQTKTQNHPHDHAEKIQKSEIQQHKGNFYDSQSINNKIYRILSTLEQEQLHLSQTFCKNKCNRSRIQVQDRANHSALDQYQTPSRQNHLVSQTTEIKPDVASSLKGSFIDFPIRDSFLAFNRAEASHRRKIESLEKQYRKSQEKSDQILKKCLDRFNSDCVQGEKQPSCGRERKKKCELSVYPFSFENSKQTWGLKIFQQQQSKAKAEGKNGNKPYFLKKTTREQKIIARGQTLHGRSCDLGSVQSQFRPLSKYRNPMNSSVYIDKETQVLKRSQLVDSDLASSCLVYRGKSLQASKTENLFIRGRNIDHQIAQIQRKSQQNRVLVERSLSSNGRITTPKPLKQSQLIRSVCKLGGTRLKVDEEVEKSQKKYLERSQLIEKVINFGKERQRDVLNRSFKDVGAKEVGKSKDTQKKERAPWKMREKEERNLQGQKTSEEQSIRVPKILRKAKKRQIVKCTNIHIASTDKISSPKEIGNSKRSQTKKKGFRHRFQCGQVVKRIGGVDSEVQNVLKQSQRNNALPLLEQSKLTTSGETPATQTLKLKVQAAFQKFIERQLQLDQNLRINKKILSHMFKDSKNKAQQRLVEFFEKCQKAQSDSQSYAPPKAVFKDLRTFISQLSLSQYQDSPFLNEHLQNSGSIESSSCDEIQIETLLQAYKSAQQCWNDRKNAIWTDGQLSSLGKKEKESLWQLKCSLVYELIPQKTLTLDISSSSIEQAEVELDDLTRHFNMEMNKYSRSRDFYLIWKRLKRIEEQRSERTNLMNSGREDSALRQLTSNDQAERGKTFFNQTGDKDEKHRLKGENFPFIETESPQAISYQKLILGLFGL